MSRRARNPPWGRHPAGMQPRTARTDLAMLRGLRGGPWLRLFTVDPTGACWLLGYNFVSSVWWKGLLVVIRNVLPATTLHASYRWASRQEPDRGSAFLILYPLPLLLVSLFLIGGFYQGWCAGQRHTDLLSRQRTLRANCSMNCLTSWLKVGPYYLNIWGGKFTINSYEGLGHPHYHRGVKNAVVQGHHSRKWISLFLWQCILWCR